MNNIAIENAKIFFLNFSGKEGQFNPAGRRNFCVEIPDDLASDLERSGWNVKYSKVSDEDRADGISPSPYLQVTVNYGNKPPKIVVISEGEKSMLDESTVDMLDWADIQSVDLEISPYSWEIGNKHGVKAYLKSMYVTLEEDPFEAKYR